MCGARDGRNDDQGMRTRARGGGEIHGLFEVRTGEGIRLVEDREHVQTAPVHDALDRELVAVHVALHLNRLGRLVAQLAHVWSQQQRAHARERRTQLRGVVGADHAAAARQHERLHHARIAHAGRRRDLPARHGHRPRRSEAGLALRGAKAPLVSARAGSDHRVPRQTARLGDERRQHHRAVTHCEHPVEPRAPQCVEHGRRRGGLVVKPHRDGPITPRVVESIASIGGQHKVHAEARGGLVERPRLVARGRRAQQHARLLRDIAHVCPSP